MNKREVILFRKKVKPLEEIELVERIKGEGAIKSLKLRYYLGQELQLQVLPFIRHKGNKIEYMTTSPTNQYYIAGDDDSFSFDVHIGVQNDDEMVVKAKNTNDTYEYDLICDIEIEYYEYYEGGGM